MNRTAVALSLLVGVAALIGVAIVAATLLRPEPEPEPITLLRPAAGDVRADHLPDGTPVWVIGHEDGSASVLSGFDTHKPFNIGKLLWWCEPAQALDNPHHGSHWDEYGRRFGGPAPSDLPSWEVHVRGSRLVLGARRAWPPVAMPAGPPESEREWCFGDEADVVFHTFDGWELWTSPGAAIEAAPPGWILIEGALEIGRANGRAILCALDGCADAALATAVFLPEPGMEFAPHGPDRFIAQVRDGALLNLTRVVLLDRE